MSLLCNREPFQHTWLIPQTSWRWHALIILYMDEMFTSNLELQTKGTSQRWFCVPRSQIKAGIHLVIYYRRAHSAGGCNRSFGAHQDPIQDIFSLRTRSPRLSVWFEWERRLGCGRFRIDFYGLYVLIGTEIRLVRCQNDNTHTHSHSLAHSAGGQTHTPHQVFFPPRSTLSGHQ